MPRLADIALMLLAVIVLIGCLVEERQRRKLRLREPAIGQALARLHADGNFSAVR